MKFACVNQKAFWASRWTSTEQFETFESMSREINWTHWSRIYEYPWVMTYGGFRKGQWILDAAGGNGDLQRFLAGTGAQVVNIDHDVSSQQKVRNVINVEGDLRELHGVQSGVFHRVVNVSVLEHIEEWEKVLEELWRVLKPGGRLLLTFDVASYARWNHSIDRDAAIKLLRLFDCDLPDDQTSADSLLKMDFDEIERKPNDPEKVTLHVLCFCCDKPINSA